LRALARAAALAGGLVAAGCASNHQVSPWGGASSPPPLSAFIERPDLAARLARIDAETAHLGLTQTVELRGELPRGGGEIVVRGYNGLDPVGRPTHAVRVATPRGVVMAVGPLDVSDAARDRATELVVSLAPKAGTEALRSGTDLNGDGAPDVVLRNDAGALEFWQITSVGSSRYEVDLEATPTRAEDMNGDGLLDLAGELPVSAGDPIAPRLVDVATFDNRRYSDQSAAARAWHAAQAAKATPKPEPKPDADAKPPTPIPDELRLRRAIERAWHTILAGRPAERALEELKREPVPPRLRAAFDRHLARIEALAARFKKPDLSER
jgi:hypothetical protein